MTSSIRTNNKKNSIHIKKVDTRLIYFIIYYIKDGDDGAFKKAATTRQMLIRAKLDPDDNSLILLYPVTTGHDFKSCWQDIKDHQKETISLIKEGHIFSHASKGETEDGLEFFHSDEQDGTINYEEIIELPSLSWSINSTLTLYGCNTGLTGSVRDFSIADVFHERQKTKIIAQRGYAYFSEQEDTYTKTSIDSLSIFLWAYNRGQNSILGSGEKIPPQIIEM